MGGSPQAVGTGDRSGLKRLQSRVEVSPPGAVCLVRNCGESC